MAGATVTVAVTAVTPIGAGLISFLALNVILLAYGRPEIVTSFSYPYENPLVEDIAVWNDLGLKGPNNEFVRVEGNDDYNRRFHNDGTTIYVQNGFSQRKRCY